MAGEDFAVVWIVGGAIAFAGIIALVVWAVKAAAARAARIRAAFIEVGKGLGLGFIDRDDTDRPRRYLAFTPFGNGHTRRADDILTGAIGGVGVELFTYQYSVTTSNGKTTTEQTYFTSVVALEMPIDGRNLTLSKETLGKRIFDALGGSDIDFESDEFSRAFWVKCDERKFAYDVITPQMMDWLLPLAGNHHAWQWRGRTLMVTTRGRLRPEGCLDLLSYAQGLRDRLPRHVLPTAPAPSRPAPRRARASRSST
jgi:hypothetical protein